MDGKTGTIYPSYDDMVREIGTKAAKAHGVTGPKPTLRKLKKMIRKQIREARDG